MFMFDKAIKSLIALRRPNTVLLRMKDAERLNLKAYSHYRDLLRMAKVVAVTGSPTSRDRLKRDLAYQRLRLRRNRYYFHDWCERLLAEGMSTLRKDPTWLYRRIPQILEYWGTYLPPEMCYQTPSGFVVLNRAPDGLNGELEFSEEQAESSEQTSVPFGDDFDETD